MRRNELKEAYANFIDTIEKTAITYPSTARDFPEDLYDVDTKPGYEHNIIELAHPESPAIVALPSDIINGLVENKNERQNIILNKITRFPSHYVFPLIKTPSYRKTSSKKLALSLIKIGNDADLINDEEIRVLADNCLDELTKEAQWYQDVSDMGHRIVDSIGGANADRRVNDAGNIGQGAIEGAAAGALIGAITTSWGGPLALGGAGVGALIGGAAGGIIAAIGNTSPAVKNIKANAAELLSQMDDLKKAVPEESSFFQATEKTMKNLVSASDRYLAAISAVRAKYVGKEEVSSSETTAISDAAQAFKASTDAVARLDDEFNRKNRMGSFASAKSSIPHFGLVADDIEDVEQSFQSLAVAISDVNKTMGMVNAKAKEEVRKEAETPATIPVPQQPLPSGQGPTEEHYKQFRDLLGGGADQATKDFLGSLK